MSKEGGHEWRKYVYDEYNDRITCPEYKALRCATANREGYREYKIPDIQSKIHHPVCAAA